MLRQARTYFFRGLLFRGSLYLTHTLILKIKQKVRMNVPGLQRIRCINIFVVPVIFSRVRSPGSQTCCGKTNFFPDYSKRVTSWLGLGPLRRRRPYGRRCLCCAWPPPVTHQDKVERRQQAARMRQSLGSQQCMTFDHVTMKSI